MGAVSRVQADVSLESALKGIVTRGQRVLVVGCPPGSFPEKLTRHASLLFWPSSEAKASDGFRLIPTEVGAVLTSRLLSHALSANVRSQARARNLVAPTELFSPGNITRLLQTVVAEAHPPQEQTTMPRVAETARITTVATPVKTPAPPAAKPEVPADIQELLSAIDDSVAGLQLVREKVLQVAEQYAAVREDLETLSTLKRLLK
jgi:hypothetical protein